MATRDLDRLTDRLHDAFAAMAGAELLITGGAGFLGYYLVQAPLAWNAVNPSQDPIRVTVHDNFLRGVPSWLSGRDDRALRVVERDVMVPLPTTEPRFDHIIHAASVASPTYYRRHPIETMDANVGGLRVLLDHAAARADTATPVHGLLFFSTSEIYGDPDPANIPTIETYRGQVSCTGPRACYDESKRYGETLCVNFAHARGVAVTIARPFNNYGPGLRIDDRRVLPDLARDVLADRDVVLLSDGRATRTFCYVMDAVDGYYRILTAGRPGEPYNIGADRPEISVRELADRVVDVAHRLTGYAGQVVQRTSDDPDYLTDNPSRRCPVIDKARTELGYEPEVELDEGLERALRWYLAEGGS
ncbi:NAD-dependent epimerase/dehydratase family protein [Nitriliruptor alkaliphilus]|uniref:NAD-dependent epimerase/dehydratase family protein n=1 Tax=Nitriliruptor alkaliphilus TaxID=427918 RepID=UPI001B8063CE|nr:NAD-dependent epimerase/dehydratase family protein [Nitriliruptor alkaliphilus]